MFLMVEQRVKKYICPVVDCGSKYSRPCLLRQHVMTHKNDRPFMCPHPGCEKSFFRASHLRTHTWTHSIEKPISCPICFKGFVTNQQFTRHYKTHKIGDIMTKDFELQGTVDDGLLMREKVGGPVINHKCPYDSCTKNFALTTELNEHMLGSHIVSPIISGLEPTGWSQGQDMVTVQDFDEINAKETPDFIWDDLSCKSKFCSGASPFHTTADLISHYDSNHTFIPETLYLTAMDDGSGDSGTTKANGD